MNERAVAVVEVVEERPELFLAWSRADAEVRPRPGYALLKRGFDVALALASLALLAPVLALVALLIRLDSPGPAIFRQRRVGRSSGRR